MLDHEDNQFILRYCLTKVIFIFSGLDNLHKVSEALKWRENRRNFIIGRGSYVGSHRYAGLWTGDNSSDWDFLQTNITQVC